MNTQPEALQMSDVVNFLAQLRQSEKEGWRYADELEQERKRLHEVNQMLIEVLERWSKDPAAYPADKTLDADTDAALAKAKGKV